jgi:NADP-dependent 3-hydroxy acid dehydrogenase YdfG
MGNTKSVAIITGASQGIGRATAIRLARDFSPIVLVARDQDSLETTAAEVRSLGAEAMAFALDCVNHNQQRASPKERSNALAESTHY